MVKVGIIGTNKAIAARIAQWQKVAVALSGSYWSACNTSAEVDMPVENWLVYDTVEQLIQAVDVVDIVSDDPGQKEWIYQAILHHKPLLIHNPFVLEASELYHIAKLIQEAKLKCQVGLYLRFMHQITALPQVASMIQLVDIRHSLYDTLNVAQIYHLINNYLDLIPQLVQSQVRKLYANAVMTHGAMHDLYNLRLQFDNGAVGNLFFQTNAIRSGAHLSLYGKGHLNEVIWDGDYDGALMPNDAIVTALSSFISTIQLDSVIKVTIFDAINSVELTRELVKQTEA